MTIELTNQKKTFLKVALTFGIISYVLTVILLEILRTNNKNRREELRI